MVIDYDAPRHRSKFTAKKSAVSRLIAKLAGPADEARDDHGRWTAGGHWDRSGPEPRWMQDHGELVADALRSWKGQTHDMHIHMSDAVAGAPQPSSGTGKQMRAQAEALLTELHNNPTTFGKQLYRGENMRADRLPKVGDVLDYTDDPRGYSSNQSTAQKFAGRRAQDTEGRNRAPVMFVSEPGARGLRIKDYVDGGINAVEHEHLLTGKHLVTHVTPTSGGWTVRHEPVA